MSPGTISFFRFLILGASLWTIGEAVHRSRRELRFPKGCSLSVGVAVASILPKGLTDGFVHVLEFDLGFPFPEQFTIDKAGSKKKVSYWKNPYQSLMRKGFETKKKSHKKYKSRRDVNDEQKRKLLLKIEDAISRLGYDGRACVVRLQCELKKIVPGNSLLEDVILSLFKTTSQFSDKDCFNVTEYCSVSLLHILLHSEQMINILE